MIVYQFGAQPPTDGADLVWLRLRQARQYRNDLVAIERGRRWALRQVDDTPEVRDAAELVRVATKSSRSRAVTLLRVARTAAREAAGSECALIAEREKRLMTSARELTPLAAGAWGIYLDIEAAHRQVRGAPLYERDAVTPNDPQFVHWREGHEEGQLTVQLQGGISTADALAGTDTQCRLVMRDEHETGGAAGGKRTYRGYGTLWLRVGNGRTNRIPVWAQFPVRLHRRIPDAARWKWVRVSLRREGLRPMWSVEITVDDPSARKRSLDTSLTGAIAVEWEWSPHDDGSVCVARWADTLGARGAVVLPPGLVAGIKKPNGIQSVRDLARNGDKDSHMPGMRDRVARAILESRDARPKWLDDAARTMRLWKSPDAFYALARRWRRERCDACRPAYEALQEWELRDAHLYEYQAGARGEALRERRELYRTIAARWARMYRTALLSDQDLSREAKWGDESAWRQLAGCYELRGAIENAFGGADAIAAKWRDEPGEEDDRDWCERSRDAWIAVGARDAWRFPKRKEKTGNAWATRKANDTEQRTAAESSRKAGAKVAQ